jgi:hypothetical protein
MNRRSFLASSAISAVSCALPVSLGLLTGSTFGSALAQGANASLTPEPSVDDALFRLHNWESNPEHEGTDLTDAPFISLSTSWKASWL